ncbi:hypothetical protein Cgig2_022452 [Carnegiea gigantea]|uniref:DUF1279 domain-containing protein n=1 Tax=Carnegiea gigantea TaxID=171969 RepID=A0A9Q1KAF0_9CARY|nr:hypothetical protein Cgig2_022452 [Carnegiea gigantea]
MQIFSSKEKGEEGKREKSKGEQAKELLAKYGGAYLATSITLSLISFTLCYALISAGVDVPALLQKVGISTNETGEKVGTFALAYAAHKAASPIRTESDDCNFVGSSSWIRAVATKMTHTEKYTTVHINHLPVALAGGTSIAFDDGGLCGCGVLELATM